LLIRNHLFMSRILISKLGRLDGYNRPGLKNRLWKLYFTKPISSQGDCLSNGYIIAPIVRLMIFLWHNSYNRAPSLADSHSNRLPTSVLISEKLA
jgi:hypothetical protein